MDKRNFDQDNSTVEVKSKSRLFALLSLVLGILSVCLGMFPVPGLILGALAVALSVISRIRMGYFDSLALVGLVGGAIGLAFSASMLVITQLFGDVFASFGA